MSNTYFELKKSVIKKDIDGNEYTNNYKLSLTAFVGKENNVQLTVIHNSTRYNTPSGISYIELNNEDIDNIIGGLLERKNGEVTATGVEESKFCPPE